MRPFFLALANYRSGTRLIRPLVALLLLGPRLAAAQAPAPPASTASVPAPSVAEAGPALRHNIIKFNPLSLLAGGVSVFYERLLTPHVSVVAGYGCGGPGFGFRRELGTGAYMYRRGTAEVRYYFGSRGAAGLYAGPYLRSGTLRESHFEPDPPTQHFTGTNKTAQATVWVPGALVGYQLLRRWVAIDAFVGLQAQLLDGTINRSNQVVEGMTSPITLRTGLTVGVPF